MKEIIKLTNGLNSINLNLKNSIESKSIDLERYIDVGQFCEKFADEKLIKKILLEEVANKESLKILKILKIENELFLKNYSENQLFFDSIDVFKMKSNFLNQTENNITSIKLVNADKFAHKKEMAAIVKKHAEGKTTEVEKEVDLINYRKICADVDELEQRFLSMQNKAFEDSFFINYNYRMVERILSNMDDNFKAMFINNTLINPFFEKEFIYGILTISNELFEIDEESKFFDFFNLSYDNESMKIKKKKISYVHHLIYKIYNHFEGNEKITLWRKKIIDNLDFTLEEHQKRKTYISKSLSKHPKKFETALDSFLNSQLIKTIKPLPE